MADMNTIIEAVHEDWSSLVNRIKNETPDLKDAVHCALGALIKQRKVYYTGNKGYFLVGPTENGSNGGTVSSSGGTNGCTPMLFGTKFSHLRHSLRDRTSSSTPPMQEKLNGSGSASGGSLSSGIIDSFLILLGYLQIYSRTLIISAPK